MTRVLGEVDRIACRGRNFGFRLISLMQRLAKRHKNVLMQLSTLLAMGGPRRKTVLRSRFARTGEVSGDPDAQNGVKFIDAAARSSRERAPVHKL